MTKTVQQMTKPSVSNERRGSSSRRTFSPGDDQRQYDFEVLDIARVVRVVKGGRRFSFRATVIIGDRNGSVGMGVGKSRDVQTASPDKSISDPPIPLQYLDATAWSAHPVNLLLSPAAHPASH